MRLIVAAVGRLKDAERELCERYAKRFDAAGRLLGLGPLSIIELSESRAGSADARKADEAARLLKAAAAAGETVALDEGGKALSSEAFAAWIARRRDDGCKARRHDLAARARTRGAHRATLPLGDHPLRASLSSRLKRACIARAEVALMQGSGARSSASTKF